MSRVQSQSVSLDRSHRGLSSYRFSASFMLRELKNSFRCYDYRRREAAQPWPHRQGRVSASGERHQGVFLHWHLLDALNRDVKLYFLMLLFLDSSCWDLGLCVNVPQRLSAMVVEMKLF